MKRIFTLNFLIRAIVFIGLILIIVTAFMRSWYTN